MFKPQDPSQRRANEFYANSRRMSLLMDRSSAIFSATSVDQMLAIALELGCELCEARICVGFVREDAVMRTAMHTCDPDVVPPEGTAANPEQIFTLFGRDDIAIALADDQFERIHGSWIKGMHGLSLALRATGDKLPGVVQFIRQEPWHIKGGDLEVLRGFSRVVALALEGLRARENALLGQREIVESLGRYRDFIEQISEGVWRFQLREPVSIRLSPEEQIEAFFERGYLAECNEAMARMYGFEKPDELLGVGLSELLDPKNPQNRQYLLEFVRSGYRLKAAESVETDRHGATKYFSNNLVGVLEGDLVYGAWGTQQDITQAKELEDRLKAVANQASDASRAKSTFVANVSHEIRNPLSVIMGYADLTLDLPGLPVEARGYLESIKRNGQQLAQLLGEVLDLSKIEASRMEIENVVFPLRPLIDEVISFLRLGATEKRIELELVFSEPLPKEISSDPTKLRQILTNVIGNAIKFTEQGRVELAVRAIGRTIELIVTDSGIGISDEARAKLFQPFAQADSSTSRRFGGTGLGLTLSKRLAQALGGDLALKESVLGRGSKFVITIDAGEIAKTQVRASANHADSAPVADRLRGKRVLLVEDSEDNQVLISRYLSAAGIEVELAGNGLEGVDKARSGDYDLVVMDIQMPGVDGHEAVRRLRSGGYGKPIVALTAHAFKEDRDRALANGFSDYLTKPINRTILLKTLNSRLELH